MSHMALGDYLYQRGFLSQIKQAYPHLQLDVWIDDFRDKKKSFHDARSDFLSNWIAQESFVNQIYPIAKSAKQREVFVSKGKKQHYDIVIFIATARSRKFAKHAKKIAGKGQFCAGVIGEKFWKVDELLFLGKLDHVIVHSKSDKTTPIRERYRQQFSELTGTQMHSNWLPLSLNTSMQNRAQQRIHEWHTQHNSDFSLLINNISTTSKRDYSWEKLSKVISELAQKRPNWLFIVNTPPHHLAAVNQQVKALRKERQINVVPYTATEGVNELAATIDQVDGVLSVETAIIHFAAVLGTNQVVLMRQKTAFWCPSEAKQVLVAKDRIDDIAPKDVIQACLDCFSERPL